MSIKELRSNNFGSFKQIEFLLRDVLNNKPQKLESIHQYCTKISIDWAYSFSGIMELFVFLAWASKNSESQIKLTSKGLKVRHLADSELKNELIRTLFAGLYENSILPAFLGRVQFKYDVTLATASLNINNIPLMYSGIRNLLLDVGFFKEINPNILVVNNDYLVFLENEIIPGLSNPLVDKKRSQKKQLTLMDLKRLLSLQENLGDQAEEFVLSFEHKMLAPHPSLDKVKIISKIDTQAGYDIISFKNLDSLTNDKFIEVKSYSDRQGFYWSRNEIQTAKFKQNQYYLYIVDRRLMENRDYFPTIIQNPYKKIFLNPEWHKEIEDWFVKIPSSPYK